MRVHAVVAIVSLLLPASLSAQRIPLTARRGPARPAPLPPQPAPIANELAYKRLRLSVESYPLISYVQSPGFTGGLITSWTTLGAGTRAEYRLTNHVAATLDLTSSLLGGPAITQTVELGTRFGPERSESKWYPFADLRVGYIDAYSRNLGTIDDIYGYSTQSYGPRYSRGFGGVGGAGVEYALTRTLFLTTAASVMRSRMAAHDIQMPQTFNRRYAMTAYRYTLGLRYNWVRVVRPVATDLR